MPEKQSENRFIALSDVVSLYTFIAHKFKFHAFDYSLSTYKDFIQPQYAKKFLNLQNLV